MDNRNCLICTVPINVTHLGIEACRACAAFFKRTEIAGRKFVCRQGDGKCLIRKHEKFMCRSCRYAKCVELGMRYVLPVKKKPRLVEKRREEVEVIVNAETPSTSSPPSILSSSSSATTPRPAREPRNGLIERFAIEYKASVERRILLEKEYVARQNLPKLDFPNEDFYIANFTAFYELYRIAIKESVTLPLKIFDNFEDLPIDHRVSLFKNFVNKFSMIECLYYSTKYFKDDISMFMASLITVADVNNMDAWMTNDGIEKKIVKKEAFRSTVKGYTNDYMDLFGPMSKMHDLTEQELHALAVLNFCDVDTSLDLPDEIISQARITRSRIFEELQDYYRNDLKLHDFSKRLGNLMIMAHGATETSALMNEEMRMYAAMFDVYADDQFFREFFSP